MATIRENVTSALMLRGYIEAISQTMETALDAIQKTREHAVECFPSARSVLSNFGRRQPAIESCASVEVFIHWITRCGNLLHHFPGVGVADGTLSDDPAEACALSFIGRRPQICHEFQKQLDILLLRLGEVTFDSKIRIYTFANVIRAMYGLLYENCVKWDEITGGQAALPDDFNEQALADAASRQLTTMVREFVGKVAPLSDAAMMVLQTKLLNSVALLTERIDRIENSGTAGRPLVSSRPRSPRLSKSRAAKRKQKLRKEKDGPVPPRAIRLDGILVPLSKTECNIASALWQGKDHTLSEDELRRKVWPGQIIESIKSQMHRLKTTLKDHCSWSVVSDNGDWSLRPPGQ